MSDIIRRANAFLDHYNYFKNTNVNNMDITMARKLINFNLLKDLNIDKDGFVSGMFLNEACNLRKVKGEDNYKLIEESTIKRFENQEVKFNIDILNTKCFKCYSKSLIKPDKCMFESCPYMIALQALDACKYINREEDTNYISNDNTVGNIIDNSNMIDNNDMANRIIQYNNSALQNSGCNLRKNISNKQTKQVKEDNYNIDIIEEIRKIGSKKIREELEKIYNRISLIKNNNSLNIIPSLYLITGDNKVLKTEVIDILNKMLNIINIKQKVNKINLLVNAKYSFNDQITIIKNYDKVCADGYFQQKELFLTTLYALEEYNGFVIIDTTTTAGIDLLSILNKNSIDIKLINLEINDYSEEDLIDLFKSEVIKLGFDINENVSNLFDKGYMKLYMKSHSNLKNKPLIDHLITSICDNMAKDNRTTIEEKDFPNLLDKSVQQQSVEEKLNKLIGLQSVKKQLTDLMSYLTFLKKMDGKMNMPVLNLHSVFSGSPGTGKTTIARIYANMLYDLGYIKENKLIEVAREDLIAEYVGQTAVKTKNVFDKAMGGVLFIDEAYSLTPTNGNGFESECISTMIKIMEDKRDDIVVIFAGYENDMQEFLNANEGLRSRVTNHVVFNDYSEEELYQILENSIIELNLKLDISAKSKVMDIISEAKKDKTFGNGRYIMNLRQKALMKHAINTAGITDEEELLIITANDFD